MPQQFQVNLVCQDLVSPGTYSFREEIYFSNYGKHIAHGLQQFVGINIFFLATKMRLLRDKLVTMVFMIAFEKFKSNSV